MTSAVIPIALSTNEYQFTFNGGSDVKTSYFMGTNGLVPTPFDPSTAVSSTLNGVPSIIFPDSGRIQYISMLFVPDATTASPNPNYLLPGEYIQLTLYKASLEKPSYTSLKTLERARTSPHGVTPIQYLPNVNITPSNFNPLYPNLNNAYNSGSYLSFVYNGSDPYSNDPIGSIMSLDMKRGENIAIKITFNTSTTQQTKTYNGVLNVTIGYVPWLNCMF